MDTGLNNITGREFPTWEQVVPSARTSRSQCGNCVYTAGTSGANYRYFGSVLRSLRYAACLLLLMVVGVGSAWGQDTPEGTDRSGYYYIINLTIQGNGTRYDASNPQNGYYLCPAAPPANPSADYNYDAVYYDGNDEKQKPYLTTYQKGRVNDAVWKIEFAVTDNGVDYYYLKHCSENKYLTYNNPIIATDAHRIAVHLQTEKDGEYSMFCFETGYHDETSFYIRPRKVTSGNRHLNPTNKNYNQYDGSTDGGKKTKVRNKDIYLGGMVGLYSKADHSDDQASHWYLEKAAPVIKYNSSNRIEISYIFDEDASIYYSYGEESTPSPSSEGTFSYSETGSFDPPAGTTMIKAIAVNNGKESGVATFTPLVLLGNSHKYLIQAQGNGWTTGDFQGCHYYMIPGDVESSITKVNTTSMLRPSMQWYFLNAGDNYYYIVNNVDNTRMRYNTTNGVHMDTWNDSNANEFKFKIVESATAGTYNIIPYGVTTGNMYLNKASGNPGANALILHSSATDANSRWKFVPQDTPLADTPPFTPSGANTSVYYKIRNGNGTTYHITPPASEDGNATASTTDDATVSWYFIKVEDPTAADWLAYYKIINAGTGKALYYAYTANNSPCLKAGDYDGSNDNYKFAFVKSTTADYYYIVPKSHKDDQLNNISTFYRDGSNIKPATTRAASGNVWTFIPADLFCNDPEFVEENGVIKINCNTNAAIIYINTANDNNPTATTENMYNPASNNWDIDDPVRIKAIAVVSDGTNTASSDVVTLLNKPDITVSSVTYTGTALPAISDISEVSIGDAPNKTTAPSGTYEIDYANCQSNVNVPAVNSVNLPTVVLKDVAGDNWYIWNASTTFTISPASVTVKADNKTKEYGTPDPAWTATVTGMQNGESAAEKLSYTFSRTEGESIAGSPYTITPSGEANQGNYIVTSYENGSLTITQKSIGDGSIATGFTYVIESDNSITLKDGETTLIPDPDDTDADVKDYFVASGSEPTSSGKYTTRTVSGRGNYTGSFNIRNAIVHLKNDNNGGTEYSATFVAESAGNTDIGHALPEGMTAYIITDITGDWAIPEQLDYIPAGVPVLLLANNEINGFEVKNAVLSNDVAEVTETQIGNNMLEEVTETTTGYVNNDQSENYQKAYFDTKQIYLLYNNEFVWNKAGYLAKWKVYLNPNHATPTQDPDPDPDPDPSPAPSRLKIAWHRTSDISNIPTSAIEGRSQWYTIDGRRMNGKPSAKGLYIVEGKKVMVR